MRFCDKSDLQVVVVILQFLMEDLVQQQILFVHYYIFVGSQRRRCACGHSVVTYNGQPPHLHVSRPIVSHSTRREMILINELICWLCSVAEACCWGGRIPPALPRPTPTPPPPPRPRAPRRPASGTLRPRPKQRGGRFEI